MNEAVLKLLKLPPLISSKLLSIYNMEDKITLMPEYGTLDIGLSRLIRSPHMLDLLPCKDTRTPLGRYFERCVEIFLRATYSQETIQSNIKIKTPHTQGELDFVITSICKTIHLEVALKFFLYRPEGNNLQLSHFHGPNLNDRLDLKLDKLITSQLRKTVPLDVRAPAIHTFRIERRLWLTGILYYPIKLFFENSYPDISSIGINPHHEKSWWARPSQLYEGKTHITKIFELSKNEWFQDWENLESKTPFDINLLQNLIEPIFVVAFDASGRELPRGFIVPENW